MIGSVLARYRVLLGETYPLPDPDNIVQVPVGILRQAESDSMTLLIYMSVSSIQVILRMCYSTKSGECGSFDVRAGFLHL